MFVSRIVLKESQAPEQENIIIKKIKGFSLADSNFIVSNIQHVTIAICKIVHETLIFLCILYEEPLCVPWKSAQENTVNDLIF